MTIRMNDNRLVTLGQLEAFTRATHSIVFVGASRKEKYAWIEELLSRFFYFTLRKRDKMTVRAYMMKRTGYSDAQVTGSFARRKQPDAFWQSHHPRAPFRTIYDRRCRVSLKWTMP